MSVFSNQINVQISNLPFKHIVVDNLFNDEFYQLLCKEFDKRLKLGLSEEFTKKQFWKFGHYDAYCWTLKPNKDQAFSKVFYSPKWQKWVNKFFDLKLNYSVIAEFHHHLPNSADGYIHTDYDKVSFMDEPMDNGINPFRHQFPYRGWGEDADIRCVRSLAMLYYFNNPEWNAGDGGETALIKDASDRTLVEPRNNRLLAFEVSPKSYHTFISNKKNVRNSLSMWFHSDTDWMTKRHKQVPQE